MSAAIKIVAPSPSSSSTPEPSAKGGGEAPKGTKLCRNVFVFGYCKHENDGCMFSHPKAEDSSTQQAPSSAGGSPASSPVVARSALSVQHAQAPAFVPKAAAASGSTPVSGISPVLSAATPAFVLGGGGSRSASPARPGTANEVAEQYSQLSLNAPAFDPSRNSTSSAAPPLENPYPQQPGPIGLDPYYPHRLPPTRQPLDYHLYTTPLPHITNLHPSQTPTHTFFLSPSLREDLQRRSEALLETSSNAAALTGQGGLPEELHVYHSLCPLEPGTVGSSSRAGTEGSSGEKSKRVFGLGTEVYKAVCELDGNAYVLRRAEGFKIMHDTAFSPIESWRRIRHPNVVSVREAFTTRLFGDNSVIFAYDYHPTSSTLFTTHFVPKPPSINPKTGRLVPQEMHIPERTLWSYTVQLCNALRAIHDEGLAARMVGELTKVLVTGKERVRINCCGMLDVLGYDGGSNIATQQLSDLLSLGHLLLSLASLNLSAASPQNLPKSLDHLSRNYSAEFRDLVLFLLGLAKNGKSPSGIGEVLAMLGGRVFDELNASMNYTDILESEMTRELENGRVVRLFTKFGFINERPEFDHDPRWSESGDRYILKLFRDMVFHQVDEYGKPVLDLSHVLMCLNKLDAGSDEKVMLMSRDEQSCLVVSYREIKACVEAAFNDLSRPS